MDKLCDSDADSADTDPEMPPYGQALISERGITTPCKDALCDSDSEADTPTDSDAESDISTGAQIGALLDLLPRSSLAMLLMHLNTLMTMCGGILRCGTVCSGTDLVVVWICSFFRIISERFSRTFQYEHTFSCEHEDWKTRWILQNFRPSMMFKCIHEVATGTAQNVRTGVMEQVPKVHALWAGFSCKSVSGMNIHKHLFKRCVRDGGGTTGATCRSCLRYIAWCRPYLVFLENVVKFAIAGGWKSVTGVLDRTVHKLSQNLLDLLEMLEALGYTCIPMILSPLDFGVPNRRPRFWLAAMWNPIFVYHSVPRVMQSCMDAFSKLPAQALAKYLLSLESDDYLYWSQDWLSFYFLTSNPLADLFFVPFHRELHSNI